MYIGVNISLKIRRIYAVMNELSVAVFDTHASDTELGELFGLSPEDLFDAGERDLLLQQAGIRILHNQVLARNVDRVKEVLKNARIPYRLGRVSMQEESFRTRDNRIIPHIVMRVDGHYEDKGEFKGRCELWSPYSEKEYVYDGETGKPIL